MPDPRVRWLDPDADFLLMCELWQDNGASLSRQDSKDLHNEGYRYCGIIEGKSIVALAAVWMYSATAWELAAVQTQQGNRSRGYSKAVCSFATAHILANGRTATCSTRADNVPMLRVAAHLGFRPINITSSQSRARRPIR